MAGVSIRTREVGRRSLPSEAELLLLTHLDQRRSAMGFEPRTRMEFRCRALGETRRGNSSHGWRVQFSPYCLRNNSEVECQHGQVVRLVFSGAVNELCV